MSTLVVRMLDNFILLIFFVQEMQKIFESAYIFELFCYTFIITPFTFAKKYFCADNVIDCLGLRTSKCVDGENPFDREKVCKEKS